MRDRLRLQRLLSRMGASRVDNSFDITFDDGSSTQMELFELARYSVSGSAPSIMTAKCRCQSTDNLFTAIANAVIDRKERV